jgi:hypothetical protein
LSATKPRFLPIFLQNPTQKTPSKKMLHIRG